MPAIDFSSSIDRREMLPLPPEASESRPGCFLASAMNSATERAGTEPLTTSTFGAVLIITTGVKSATLS